MTLDHPSFLPDQSNFFLHAEIGKDILGEKVHAVSHLGLLLQRVRTYGAGIPAGRCHAAIMGLSNARQAEANEERDAPE